MSGKASFQETKQQAAGIDNAAICIYRGVQAVRIDDAGSGGIRFVGNRGVV